MIELFQKVVLLPAPLKIAESSKILRDDCEPLLVEFSKKEFLEAIPSFICLVFKMDAGTKVYLSYALDTSKLQDFSENKYIFYNRLVSNDEYKRQKELGDIGSFVPTTSNKGSCLTYEVYDLKFYDWQNDYENNEHDILEYEKNNKTLITELI